MRRQRILSLTIAALTLTACAHTPPQAPTRLEVNPLGFHSTAITSDDMTEQAQALTAQANAIVRASTRKGAMMGAAVGCGVTVLTTSNPSKCVTSAAIGAASGALAGNIAGKGDVQRRVTLASPNALVRNLRKANDSLDTIETSLPALLAQQDAELNQITLAFAASQISKDAHDAHDAKIETIRTDRANLAKALMQSAQTSQQAAANLRAASAAGHSGLDWHISATDQLARETLSARSTISLL